MDHFMTPEQIARETRKTPQSPLAQVTSLADCTPNPPHFAVENLLPTASLTTLVGPANSGKTTCAALLAASDYPPYYKDDPATPTVLWVSPFTDPYHTLRPLLSPLGITPGRLQVAQDFSVPTPGSALARQKAPCSYALLDYLAPLLSENRSYRLLVLDSAELFFQASSRPSPGKLLTQLHALQVLAQRTEIAILLLATAPQRKNPLSSPFLSCLSQASATTYFLAKDDQEQRYLFPLKHTLNFSSSARQLPQLSASTPRFPALPEDWPTRFPSEPLPELPEGSTPEPVNPQEDAAHAHVLSLLPTLEQSYPEYLRQLQAPRPRGPQPLLLDFTGEVLLEQLKEGPVLAEVLKREVEAATLSWGTALRAKPKLQIRSRKVGQVWYWFLPEHSEPQPAHQVTSQVIASQPTLPSDCAHTPETCAPSRFSEGSDADQTSNSAPSDPLDLEPEISDLKSPSSDCAHPPETCAPSHFPSVSDPLLPALPPSPTLPPTSPPPTAHNPPKPAHLPIS